MASRTGITDRATLAGAGIHNSSLAPQFGPDAGNRLQRARWSLGEMVGRSSSMERLFLQMRYLASHLRLGLIEGERGTGKLLTAQTLHATRSGPGGKFIACAAARFLAGHAPAAILEEARGGTLYLSGLETLQHDQQGLLLHMLGWFEQQHGQGSQPAGLLRPGRATTSVFQCNAAAVPRTLLLGSTRPVRSLVLQDRFRADLEQKLSAVQLVLPPLRERREDIAMLAELFLARFRKHFGKPLAGLADDALPWLAAQDWPGNVAELETAINRAGLRAPGKWLQASGLQQHGLRDDTGARPQLAAATSYAAGRAGGVAAVAAPGKPTRGITPWPARLIGAPGTSVPLATPPAATLLGTRLALERAPSHFQRLAWDQAPPSDPSQGASLVAPEDSIRDAPFDPNLDRAILRQIHRVLQSVHGNKLQAARLLGISRSTLYRLLSGEVEAETNQLPVP